VPCDRTVWREDIDSYYRSFDILSETEEYRTRLVSIALFEVVISGADATFDAGDFGQRMLDDANESSQVAYDEAVLSADGRSVVKRRVGCANGMREGRIRFFLRHYDPVRPVRWTYGEFTCPPTQPIDDRLVRILPYREI
jgi:hypothetical protein